MKKNVFIFSLILVLIDQFIKGLVINNMNLYESIKVIPNFFKITYVENDGGAFSLFSGGRWFFIVLAIIVVVFLVRLIIIDNKVSKFDRAAYSLVLGGVVGNLIDRIFYGKVIDYIDFNLFGYDAPVFNFADMCIVFGALMIVYILIVKGDSDANIYSRK